MRLACKKHGESVFQRTLTGVMIRECILRMLFHCALNSLIINGYRNACFFIGGFKPKKAMYFFAGHATQVSETLRYLMTRKSRYQLEVLHEHSGGKYIRYPKRGKSYVALALLIFCAWFAAAHEETHASPLEKPPTYIEDPLLAAPPELFVGKSLPGDSEIVRCPTAYDVNKILNLELAIDLALCRNPRIKSTWAAIKGQAAILGEARAAYFPVLSGSISRLNDQTNYPNPSDNLSPTYVRGTMVYANLVWRIFDFGGRNANRRSANYLLEAAIASHDAAIQRALVNVVEKYFETQTALAAWEAKKAGANYAKQTLMVAEQRESRGVGAQTDTLMAATALAKATLERNRAQGNYHKMLSELANILGLNPGFKFVLAQSKSTQDHIAQRDLNAWLSLVQAHHPSISAARKQLESANEKRNVALSDGMPSIDFTANFFQNGRPNQGLTLVKTQETLAGFTLNIPIFDGFAKAYKVRGAEAEVEQKKAELQEVESQISMEVVKAYADTTSAIKNIDSAQLLLNSANSSLKSIARKFEFGASDILEILNAQASLADAQQEQIRCLAELRSAKLRLYASAGVMGRILVAGQNY